MKACLYLLETLADWEIGYLTAELNSGRFFGKTADLLKLIKVGDTIKSISTMGGITITPDAAVKNIIFNSGDLLILPGADTWLEDSNKKVINLIPELLERGVIVAAICGATVALAKSGILNNRKHTSNNKTLLKMTCPEYLGENLYSDQPVVAHNNLL